MASITDLTPETFFDVFSNARRRKVLLYLDERSDGRADINDVAARTAADELGVPVDEVDDDDRRRLYVSLHQAHVPKLEEHGFVRYDRSDNVVSITDRGERVVDYLDPTTRDRSRWPDVTLAASLVAGAAVTLVALGVAPFDTVPLPLASQLVVVGFVALAVLQYVRRRREGDFRLVL
jgi:hypothetical protein